MKKTFLFILAFVAITLATQAQWIEQATGFTTASRGISCVDVVSPNVVWAVAYDGSGGAAYINEFTRTTNGGNLWTPGQVLGGTTYGLGNISAVNDQIAYVSLYNGTGAQDATCGVYKTVNGGTTWTHMTGALQGSSSFADNVWFFDANNGIAHGDVNGGYFEIYTTTNGGTTWTRVPQSNINATVASGEGGWTSVIDGDKDSTVMFGTNKGKIYVSNDRGFHWFGVATGIVPATGGTMGVAHIAFLDKMHGLVAQGYNSAATSGDTTLQIFSTSDGGHTWAPVTFTGRAFSNSLAAVIGSPNTYVTHGGNPNYSASATGVTYSWDGGHTFNVMASTLGTQYLAAKWYNDSTAWSGHFNTDNVTGGIWKWQGHLEQPAANFMTPDTLLALGGTATFTNESTGYPDTFHWTFQDGTPSSSTLKNPPAITYNTPGFKNVTLVASSDYGTNTKVKTAYIYVGNVGINELNPNSVSVFPNPAKDFVTVQANTTIKEINVYSTSGQLVISNTFNAKTVNVITSGLSKGVYSLKATLDNGTINKKIVIQ
jgi:PKD repeat protein